MLKDYHRELTIRNELIEQFYNKFLPADGKKMDWNSADLLKEKMFPKSLCKYLSLDDAKIPDALEDFRLWFTRADCQNDLFESLAVIDETYLDEHCEDEIRLLVRGILGSSKTKKWATNQYRRAAITNYFRTQDELNRWQATAKRGARERILSVASSTFITCLSEGADCPLMWAHYAKNHAGLCVEFCGESIKNSVLYENLLPVLYSSKRLTLTDKTYRLSFGNNTDNDHEPKSSFLMRIALTKAIEWSYEREWRYALLEQTLARLESAKKDGHCYKIPFVNIKNIYLGVNNSYPQDILSWLKDYSRKYKIGLYKMKRHQSMFRLIPESLL